MAFDVDGRLIVCEQVSSCLTRFHADGWRELVAFHYQGMYLNSPNDVVARGSDGSIYFTDPDYGRWNDWIGAGARAAIGSAIKAVFRVPPGGGELELVVRRGRVRPAERAVLLARRDAALRQRLRIVPRSRSSTSPPTASLGTAGCCTTGIGSGAIGRGQRRRHGVRRARQRLGHRAPAACGC